MRIHNFEELRQWYSNAMVNGFQQHLYNVSFQEAMSQGAANLLCYLRQCHFNWGENIPLHLENQELPGFIQELENHPTTTYAKCRPFKLGERFCAIIAETEITFFCTGDLYECWQPDAIENEEYNLVILIGARPVRARTIDFDFEERKST